MAHTYSIAEARSRLRSIVDQAQAGLEVELTRRGRPVAAVVSCRELQRLRGRHPQFHDVYSRFRDQYPPERVDPDQEFSSVRDRTRGRPVVL